jgi:hypothetical protein
MDQPGDKSEHESWPRSVFERVRSWWNRDDDDDDDDGAKPPWYADKRDFGGTGALRREPGRSRNNVRRDGKSSENDVIAPEADGVADPEADEGAESKGNP